MNTTFLHISSTTVSYVALMKILNKLIIIFSHTLHTCMWPVDAGVKTKFGKMSTLSRLNKWDGENYHGLVTLLHA